MLPLRHQLLTPDPLLLDDGIRGQLLQHPRGHSRCCRRAPPPLVLLGWELSPSECYSASLCQNGLQPWRPAPPRQPRGASEWGDLGRREERRPLRPNGPQPFRQHSRGLCAAALLAPQRCRSASPCQKPRPLPPPGRLAATCRARHAREPDRRNAAARRQCCGICEEEGHQNHPSCSCSGLLGVRWHWHGWLTSQKL